MGAQAPALRVDRGVLVPPLDQEGHASRFDFPRWSRHRQFAQSTLVRISDGHELCFWIAESPVRRGSFSHGYATHHESTPEVLVTFHPKTQVILLVRSGLQGVRPCSFVVEVAEIHIP